MVYRNNPAQIKKRNKTLGVIVALLILLFVGAVGFGGYLAVTGEMNGNRNLGEEPVVLAVQEGSSLKGIAKMLAENKVINSSLVFELYCKVTGAGADVQFGDHQCFPNASYDDILAALSEPFVVKREGIQITFQEGMRALGMAEKLESAGFFSVDEFLSVCNNDTFEGNVWPQISTDTNKFCKLEGFLFPDTYDVYYDMDCHEFVQSLLDNFEKKVMTEERMALVNASGYSLEQIIILSSIVEKEANAAIPDSYSTIASVFFNRLADTTDFNGQLDSDTSKDWAKYGQDDIYTEGFYYGVLQYYYGGYNNIPAGMRAAYDTYSVKGLPVGAICNPGTVAIDGTLNPADTPYFFFFYSKPNSRFYYNERLSGHESDWGLYGA